MAFNLTELKQIVEDKQTKANDAHENFINTCLNVFKSQLNSEIFEDNLQELLQERMRIRFTCDYRYNQRAIYISKYGANISDKYLIDLSFDCDVNEAIYNCDYCYDDSDIEYLSKICFELFKDKMESLGLLLKNEPESFKSCYDNYNQTDIYVTFK